MHYIVKVSLKPLTYNFNWISKFLLSRVIEKLINQLSNVGYEANKQLESRPPHYSRN